MFQPRFEADHSLFDRRRERVVPFVSQEVWAWSYEVDRDPVFRGHATGTFEAYASLLDFDPSTKSQDAFFDERIDTIGRRYPCMFDSDFHAS
jgi:hypothetical protein